jgi:hypothetical protein
MADKYDFEPEVYEIIPPIAGEYGWGAKVTYVVKVSEAGSQRIDIPHHEYWGKTWEEARKKAKEEAEAWIKMQETTAGGESAADEI